MEETRRFLRYVMPGLILFVLAFMMSFVVIPSEVKEMFSDLKDENSLTIAISGLLATGGIGFLISSIHHLLHWQLFGKMDFRPLIRELSKMQNDIGLAHDSAPECARDAWSMVLLVWSRKIGKDEAGRLLDHKLDSLLDTMHGSGSAFVASVFAFLGTLVAWSAFEDFSFTWSATFDLAKVVAIGGLSSYVFLTSYLRTVRMAHNVYEMELLGRMVSK